MNQKEIVWIRFPYSDFSERKTRPALILSNDKYNRKSNDLIICAITSNLKEAEYTVNLKQENLISGNLPIKSKVKADKIMQVNKKLVLKPFGKLENKKFKEVTAKIQQLIA